MCGEQFGPNGKEWWDLREIILEASHGSLSPLVDEYETNPIATAAVSYLNNGRDENILNQAAKLLALRKVGVDPVVAASHYWLVLEKS